MPKVTFKFPKGPLESLDFAKKASDPYLPSLPNIQTQQEGT